MISPHSHRGPCLMPRAPRPGTLFSSVRCGQLHRPRFRYRYAMNRAEHFAAPAGDTVRRIRDQGLARVLVHSKNILGTGGKTDLTSCAAFLVQCLDRHRYSPYVGMKLEHGSSICCKPEPARSWPLLLNRAQRESAYPPVLRCTVAA